MDIADPGWLVTGIALTILGILIWRWSSRNNNARELAEASAEATIGALKGGRGETREQVRERRNASSRLDVTRFVGIVGFLFVISGLLLAALGLFGT